MTRRPAVMRSVRFRVTAVASIVVAVVLVAAGWLLVDRQRRALEERLDEEASAAAERLATLGAGAGSGAITSDDLGEDWLVVIRDDQGRSSVLAEDSDDDGAARVLATRIGPNADDDTSLTIDGNRYRVAGEFDSDDSQSGSDQDATVQVVVAVPADDVDESVRDLRATLTWVIPLAVAVLIATLWVMVGRTLRPVEAIRRQVASIGGSALDRRVPVPAGDDEVARLARTMNDMLGRLEASADRQRRFVADASHELRTPLTRMRAELEVDERHPDQADAAATRRSQLDEIAGLQQMVDDLLLLARSDAGSTADTGTPVDVDELVGDEVRATTAGPAIDISGLGAAQVVGNEAELRRVVRNVLDNARRHARTRVAVTLREAGDGVVLTVDDDGPGIPPERRHDVRQRFVRLDEARSGPGSGLGLAIVDEIVRRHGGTLDIADAPTLGGARIEIHLPVTNGVRPGS